MQKWNSKMRNNRDFRAPKWAAETRMFFWIPWGGAGFWIFMLSNQGRTGSWASRLRRKRPESLVSKGGQIAGPKLLRNSREKSSELWRSVLGYFLKRWPKSLRLKRQRDTSNKSTRTPSLGPEWEHSVLIIENRSRKWKAQWRVKNVPYMQKQSQSRTKNLKT